MTATSLWIHRGDVRLAAVLDTPADAPAERGRLVIVMHGITGSKEDPVIEATAAALNGRGIATLRFDFDGHGASDGAQVDMTVPNEIEDALAVYRYARTLDSFSTISLAGHSQGGVVAGMLAGDLGDEVGGLVLMSPAGVLKENCLGGDVLGASIDPNDIPERIELPGKDFTVGREYIRTGQTLPIFETSAHYQGKVGIIQGRDDEVVPLATAEHYRDIYRQPAFHLLDGQNHGYDRDPSEPALIAARFLTQDEEHSRDVVYAE